MHSMSKATANGPVAYDMSVEDRRVYLNNELSFT